MAITRAQQVRQMYKEGSMEPVEQAGVMNYMPSEMVTVPKIAKSSPTTPTAKLAYITPEEQDILVDLNLYGSLKGKPNRGPGGIPSLEGDFGSPTGQAGGKGGTYSGGGADFGGAGGDFSAFKDTGTGNYVSNNPNVSIDEQRKVNAAIDRELKEAEAKRKADEKAKKDREIRNLIEKQQAEKVMDRRKRMGAKYVTDMFDLPADYDEEKDDTAAMLDLFVNDPYREDRTKRTLPSLAGLAVNLFEEPLKAGAKKTREFFTGPTTDIFGRNQKGVLAAGKFNYKGEPLTEERFANMSLTEKNQAYKDYMSQRMSNEIDAYGNPLNTGDGGGGDGGMSDYERRLLELENQLKDQQAAAPTTTQNPFAYRFFADGGSAGGIMDADIVGGMMDGNMDEMGRQMYGLGKLVKKATRAVKKIAKSPIGKAALLYGGGTFLGGLKAFGGAGLGSGTFLSNLKSGQGLANLGGFLKGKLLASKTTLPGTKSGGLLNFLKDNPGLTIAGFSALPFIFGEQDDKEEFDPYRGPDIDIAAIRGDPYGAMGGAYRLAADGGLMRQNYDEAGAVMSKEEMKKLSKSPLYKGFKLMYGVDPQQARDNDSYKDKFSQFEQLYKKGYQEGGDVEPVAKKTMPLIDMDGKEKDYRETGGFVDMGRMERADDVPARLSKNEFVFTADAVRNAGDGDVDKGAEVMYNMMKNLEAGGEVSEESQGLEGARKMFQTSQRLEEVL